MAKRPIWSGSLTFGLVHIPVRLFSAVSQKGVHFHLLHDKDGARIRQRRVCSLDGEEVPYEHVVKGYEVARNQYVVLTAEELASFEARVSRLIELEDFVGLDEIDPLYFDGSYHLVPDARAEKAYGLLAEAMKRARKVGLARIALRTRTSLCAIRPLGEGLVLSTMNAPDELVPLQSLEEAAPPPSSPSERELAMAEQLIASLTTTFQPDRYHDEYRERLLEFIHAKAEGKGVVGSPAPEGLAPVVNLLDALKKSLAATPRASPAAEGERRHRPEAAHARRAKPRKD